MANGDVPSVADVLSGAVLLAQDYVTGLAFSSPQWGIFNGGGLVIACDNVLTMEYKQNWNLSDYPVEKGGFETYNKVQTPFDARLKFSSGGTEANRAALLASIAAIAGDLNLYDVVTPEKIYTSVNITHYDYHRSATNGVGNITVEVWVLEVRILNEGAASFSTGTTGSTDGVSPTNDGSVSPIDMSVENMGAAPADWPTYETTPWPGTETTAPAVTPDTTGGSEAPSLVVPGPELGGG